MNPEAARPARVISFDPGEVHAGCAVFVDDYDANVIDASPQGWHCESAVERSPQGALDWLWMELGAQAVDVVVYETFQLYPQHAQLLTGSEMETSQMIGAIKWQVHHWNGVYKGGHQVEIRQQPADAKKPITGSLRLMHVKSTAKRDGTGPHALDAELHGWGYLIKAGLVKPSRGSKGK